MVSIDRQINSPRGGRKKSRLGLRFGCSLMIIFAFVCTQLDIIKFTDDYLPSTSSNPKVQSTTSITPSNSSSPTKTKLQHTLPHRRKVSTCYQNPYRNAITDDFETTVSQRAKEWLNNMSQHRQSVESNMNYWNHNHKRFWVFEPMISNCSDISCLGGPCKADTSKIVCGLNQFPKLQKEVKEGEKAPCVVYSVGGNNKWEFEYDILASTPCEVHTFDCTGPKSRFNKKPPHPRSYFHHVCLGTETKIWPKEKSCEQIISYKGKKKNINPNGICGDFWTLSDMQQRLNHTQIDLLKMDIEGFEWSLLDSWPELEEEAQSDSLLLPMQILIEVHYETQFKELVPTNFEGQELWEKKRGKRFQEFKSPMHLIDFQSHLLKMGYAVVIRDDNQFCKHCTELTLTRFQCPS